MPNPVRVGIIICDRYRTCAGGKCLRAAGADVIHLATCLLVAYPPRPHGDYFKTFITNYGTPVIVGTHPIPEKYFLTHEPCGTWSGPGWPARLEPTIADRTTRLAYD